MPNSHNNYEDIIIKVKMSKYKMVPITAKAADNLNLTISVDERFLYLKEILDKRDCAHLVLNELRSKISPIQVMTDTNEQKTWEAVGDFFRVGKRPFEAIEIYSCLYDHMLIGQLEKNQRAHKGMPLCWLYDCYNSLGFSAISKRFLLLTLIEDAIQTKDNISPDSTGVYFRLVWHRGLPHSEFQRYSTRSYQLYLSNQENGMFPEWILLQMDQDWMTEFPSNIEGNMYYLNKIFVNHLISKLGDKQGRYLEILSSYLLFSMPGARIYQRKRTNSTEFDIVCCVEGLTNDFRSELGRYFICECKNYTNKKVGYSVIAKFIRVLDSIKAKFGVIFTSTEISGKNKMKYAELEIIKAFQDRGIVIVDFDLNDIKIVMEGANFINLLRNKYEKIRLDIKY